jgi:lysylphosphatidylglycerol synthetase-like protein (DUF2156 family)
MEQLVAVAQLDDRERALENAVHAQCPAPQRLRSHEREQEREHAHGRPHEPHARTPWSQLPRDLLQHGRTCLAYGMVGDPAVQAFTCDAGSVLFGQVWTPVGKRTIVASDPLCAPRALPALLRAFLERYPNAAFFQITEPTTDALQAFGYERTHLALESTLQLRTWSKAGTRQQCMRTAANRALREGHQIMEASCSDLDPRRLAQLSAAWMQTKRLRHREISFFSRPFSGDDEPAVRKFFALRDGVPTAFVVFDPMFEAGEVFGYVAMTLRQDPAATPGLCDAIILHAATTFKSEGLRELHLGMSPFCPPRQPRLRYDEPAVSTLLVGANWHLLNVLFNHQGIAGHKQRWNAVETPVYYAGRKHRAFFDFFAAARITGLL